MLVALPASRMGKKQHVSTMRRNVLTLFRVGRAPGGVLPPMR